MIVLEDKEGRLGNIQCKSIDFLNKNPYAFYREKQSKIFLNIDVPISHTKEARNTCRLTHFSMNDRLLPEALSRDVVWTGSPPSGLLRMYYD